MVNDMLSPFNRDMVERLGRSVPGLLLNYGKTTATLSGDVDGRVISFATIRKPPSRTAHVNLLCYIPEKSSLSAEDKKDIHEGPEGRYYIYRTHDVAQAAMVLTRHFRDLERRIQKDNPEQRKGKGRIGRPRGLPLGYFKERN